MFSGFAVFVICIFIGVLTFIAGSIFGILIEDTNVVKNGKLFHKGSTYSVRLMSKVPETGRDVRAVDAVKQAFKDGEFDGIIARVHERNAKRRAS